MTDSDHLYDPPPGPLRWWGVEPARGLEPLTFRLQGPDSTLTRATSSINDRSPCISMARQPRPLTTFRATNHAMVSTHGDRSWTFQGRCAVRQRRCDWVSHTGRVRSAGSGAG